MAKTNNIQHIIKSSIINHTKNIIKDCFEDKKKVASKGGKAKAKATTTKKSSTTKKK